MSVNATPPLRFGSAWAPTPEGGLEPMLYLREGDAWREVTRGAEAVQAALTAAPAGSTAELAEIGAGAA